MIEPGRQAEINLEANKKLDKIYKERGIDECEIRMFGCWINKHVNYAHRHKRFWYKSRPELLSEFNETILACNNCHQKIEYNGELTEKLFVELRDKLHKKDHFLDPKAPPIHKTVVAQSMSGRPGELTDRQYFTITNRIRGLSEEQSHKLKHLSKTSASLIINDLIHGADISEMTDRLERMLSKI